MIPRATDDEAAAIEKLAGDGCSHSFQKISCLLKVPPCSHCFCSSHYIDTDTFYEKCNLSSIHYDIVARSFTFVLFW